MRLLKSRAAAEELITSLVNRGYEILAENGSAYKAQVDAGTYTDDDGLPGLQAPINAWGADVQAALAAIFPTKLERILFLRTKNHMAVTYLGMSQKVGDLRRRMTDLLANLEEILTSHLPRYTDLPVGIRLYVEDIDSFRAVRDVNPQQVSHLLTAQGYLDLSEDQIQLAIEQILDVAMHKKDWGGETNDLYSANTVVNGARVASAFLLKGNGLRKKTMQIADCGKNGDQLVRLVDSPAQLFFVQFVGNVSENVIRDIEGKIAVHRGSGVDAHFCIMDGQDTARVLLAYGKLAPTP